MPKLCSIFRPLIPCGLLILALSSDLSAQAPAAEEDIRGPKAVVEIPVPEKPPVALWSCVAGAAALLVLATYFWKKRLRRMQLKSPLETALASLVTLETSREALAAEAFANRAAQTVRQYLAERFGLAAPRRTTEEFFRDLACLEGSPLAGQGDHLQLFLKSCDLAKFAGSTLDPVQRGELIDAARRFMRSTSNAIAG